MHVSKLCCGVVPSVSTMAVRVRSRVTCDPNISVSGIAQALETVMFKAGNRDLIDMLESIDDISWKHAVRPQVIADLCYLIIEFMKLDPRSIISHSKLLAAVMGIHAEKACIFPRGQRSVPQTASKMSNDIRCLLSKFRTVTKDKDKLRICLTKVIRI